MKTRDPESMIFAKNFRFQMDKKGATRRDIAELLGVSSAIVSDWANGYKSPRMDKVRILADYFGCTRADLIDEHGTNPASGVKIPVLGKVAAGIPISAVEDVLDYEEIPLRMAKTGEFFALKVQGDSMFPLINSGDTVIVRQQSDVESGEIAVVLINGDDATVKRVRKTDDGIMLIPVNPSFDPIYYSAEQVRGLPVTIVGRVVELRRPF